MTAYVFPGQGAQFTGMGKDLYDASPRAKELIDSACDILGFDIRSIMFTGSADDLKQTRVTATIDNFRPDMTAGHSLGEFSALVAAGAMSFEDGLRLVYARAMAMQKACEARPSTMAAIIGLPDDLVEKVCAETEGIVEKSSQAGRRRSVPLTADGACQTGAGRGHKQDGDKGSRLPRIPERGRTALHRPGRDKGQAAAPAHLPRKMDPDGAQHAPRRSVRVRGARSRSRTAGAYQKMPSE